MSKRTSVLMAAAVVSVAGTAAMAAPSLTGIDGALHSSAFTHKYEGNVLPDAAGLGFVLNGGTNANNAITLGTSGSDDYVRIDTDTNADASETLYYQLNGGDGTNWDPHFIGGFTVEMRAIVRATNSGTFGAGLRLQEENSSGLFQFFNNKVVGDNQTYNTANNADTWHTYRIASYSPEGSSAGQIYKLWRDDVEIGTFTNNPTFSGTALIFGDYVSGLPEVNIDIDYLRWTVDGAFSPAPIPEPTAAAGLVAAGAGMMLRRRNRSAR